MATLHKTGAKEVNSSGEEVLVSKKAPGMIHEDTLFLIYECIGNVLDVPYYTKLLECEDQDSNLYHCMCNLAPPKMIINK